MPSFLPTPCLAHSPMLAVWMLFLLLVFPFLLTLSIFAGCAWRRHHRTAIIANVVILLLLGALELTYGLYEDAPGAFVLAVALCFLAQLACYGIARFLHWRHLRRKLPPLPPRPADHSPQP